MLCSQPQVVPQRREQSLKRFSGLPSELPFDSLVKHPQLAERFEEHHVRGRRRGSEARMCWRQRRVRWRVRRHQQRHRRRRLGCDDPLRELVGDECAEAVAEERIRRAEESDRA